MTSVVGILNKQAVAIAADSAVTIGGPNGRKIFNQANKVFTLSKFHPVGVAIYNSAQFMATPWETIIKIYRKELKDSQFDTLEDYKDDFIEFLRRKNFFSDAVNQKKYLQQFLFVLLDFLIREVGKENIRLFQNPSAADKAKIIGLIEAKCDEIIDNLSGSTERCEELKGLAQADFTAFARDEIDQVIENLIIANGFTVSNILKGKIETFFHLTLLVKETMTAFTGLIFTGYGKEEVFPQLIPINISFAVDDKLRYYIDEKNCAGVSPENTGFIRPFAQTDVIDTILSGVDPLLENTYLANFKASFQKYNQEILRILGSSNPQLSAQIKALDIDALVEAFAKKNNETKISNYIQPLMNAVSSLSKEDLAEMAESLIYLTYLKRRITFAEESVGGPVDVAIISKGDGFIWIKRKHYFDPALNQHFFDNYFNF